MTNDQELLEAVRGALITALPDDTPHDVIEDAALNVVQVLHAPWYPASEKRVVGASNVNVHASSSGHNPIGTMRENEGLRCGKPEGDRVPVLIHGWVHKDYIK